MFKVMDLFSGIGGFSLGLERTGGFQTTSFCEIEPFCQKILNKHWPTVPVHSDITTREFLEGEADAICAGFPCQDISNAGKRAGITGSRSGLWRESLRAIRVVRPLLVLLENVAAILGRGLGVVLGNLAESGYDAEWDCIPAKAVGALHLRDRWWCVAYPSELFGNGGRCDERWSREPLSELRNYHSQDVLAHLGQERIQRFFPQEIPKFGAFSWGENVRRIEDLRGRSDLPEPLIRRIGDGISFGVDRIGAIGNSVVPQIPELLGTSVLTAIA